MYDTFVQPKNLFLFWHVIKHVQSRVDQQHVGYLRLFIGSSKYTAIFFGYNGNLGRTSVRKEAVSLNLMQILEN